ncbi:DUF461 domain-containing protein [Streptomyces sp. NPDC088725]|uniref:DUF461 domain-containing protein n=1 Tax=Streptomyces sp. NPDC088725 TaxID=3365873 RepID=UPI00382A311F
MSRSLRRGALAATALVFSLASLSACGAGNNAQTLQIKPDSAATTSGDITIQNATVVTQTGAGADGTAAVTGTVFNNGKSRQTLDTITLPGTKATVKLSPDKGTGPVEVPAGGWVRLGGKGNASALIENGGEPTRDGDAQQLVFSFSETGDVKLRAFVVPADGYVANVGPTAPATPVQSPSGAASGTPSGTPSSPPAGHGSEEETPAGSESSAAGTAG